VPRFQAFVCASLVSSWVLLSTSASATTPTAPSSPRLRPTSPTDPPSCRDALDAVVDDTRACRSPGALSPELVAADEPAPAEVPLRAPELFASELGFFAVVSTAVGAGAIVASGFVNSNVTGPAEIRVQDGAWWGGVSLVSLGAGLGAAAVSMWVFDVSTGALRWPIFAGEDA
jgi:hypothetical protein